MNKDQEQHIEAELKYWDSEEDPGEFRRGSHADPLNVYASETRFRAFGRRLFDYSETLDDDRRTDLVLRLASDHTETFAALLSLVTRGDTNDKWPGLFRGVAYKRDEPEPKTEEEALERLRDRTARVFKDKPNKSSHEYQTLLALSVGHYVETTLRLNLNDRVVDQETLRFFDLAHYKGRSDHLNWRERTAFVEVKVKPEASETALIKRIALIKTIVHKLMNGLKDRSNASPIPYDRWFYLCMNVCEWMIDDCLDIAVVLGRSLGKDTLRKTMNTVLVAASYMVSNFFTPSWLVAYNDNNEWVQRGRRLLRRVVDYPLAENPSCDRLERNEESAVKVVETILEAENRHLVTRVAVSVDNAVYLLDRIALRSFFVTWFDPEARRGSVEGLEPAASERLFDARDYVVSSFAGRAFWKAWRCNWTDDCLVTNSMAELSSRLVCHVDEALMVLAFAASDYPEDQRERFHRIMDEAFEPRVSPMRRRYTKIAGRDKNEPDVALDAFSTSADFRPDATAFVDHWKHSAVTLLLGRMIYSSRHVHFNARMRMNEDRFLRRVLLPFIVETIDAVEHSTTNRAFCSSLLSLFYMAVAEPFVTYKSGSSSHIVSTCRFWNDHVRSERTCLESLHHLISRAQKTGSPYSLYGYFSHVPGLDPRYPAISPKDIADPKALETARWRSYFDLTLRTKFLVPCGYEKIEPWYASHRESALDTEGNMYYLWNKDEDETKNNFVLVYGTMRTVYSGMRRRRKEVELKWSTTMAMLDKVPGFRFMRTERSTNNLEDTPLGGVIFASLPLIVGRLPFDSDRLVIDASLEALCGSNRPFVNAGRSETVLATMIAQRNVCGIGCPKTRQQHDQLFLEVAVEAFRMWRVASAETFRWSNVVHNWLHAESVVRTASYINESSSSVGRLRKRSFGDHESTVLRDAFMMKPNKFFSDSYVRTSFWSMFADRSSKPNTRLRKRDQGQGIDLRPRFVASFYALLASIDEGALVVTSREEARDMKRFFEVVAPRDVACAQTLYEGIVAPLKDALFGEAISHDTAWTKCVLWEMLEETLCASIEREEGIAVARAKSSAFRDDDVTWFLAGSYHEPTNDLSRCYKVLDPGFKGYDQFEAVWPSLLSLTLSTINAIERNKLAPSYRIVRFVENAAEQEEYILKTRRIRSALANVFPKTRVEPNHVCPVCVYPIEPGQTIYVSRCNHLFHVKCAADLAYHFHKARKLCHLTGRASADMWRFLNNEHMEEPHFIVVETLAQAMNANSCPMCRHPNLLFACDRIVVHRLNNPEDFYMDRRNFHVASDDNKRLGSPVSYRGKKIKIK